MKTCGRFPSEGPEPVGFVSRVVLHGSDDGHWPPGGNVVWYIVGCILKFDTRCV